MSRQPSTRPPRFHALTRAISWHRRKLAVVAALAAVLTGVSAAVPPEPQTVEVVRAADQMAGGTTLTAGDLKLVRLPTDAVPEGALTSIGIAVGRTVSAPLARQQVLTQLSIGSPGSTLRTGRVVAPLRLADADVAALLHVGDTVDVVAADGEAKRAAVVASAVRVVGLPRQQDAGGIGSSAASTSGALLLVEVDTATATTLAQAAVTATLSILLR